MSLSAILAALPFFAAALGVLGIIIVLHELGHFLVAKLFGIKVETFSVGFGPRVVGIRYGETDYRISAFPLGGYVKMSGETPGDAVTGDPREFLSKPKWQRFLVAAAGPAMNIVLAVGLLMALFMHGTQVPEFLTGIAVVRTVDSGSPAEQAGIHVGDRIVAMAGKQDPSWEFVQYRIAINPGQTLPITLERDGQKIETSLKPVSKDDRGYAGMFPLKIVMNLVKKLVVDSPAMTAGLQPGDEIVSLNGIDVTQGDHSIQETLQTIEENEFPVTVLRGGQTRELRVAPRTEATKEGKPQKRIGVELDYPVPMVHIKLGVQEAFRLSVDKNIDSASLILTVLGKLFKPKQSGGLPVSQLEGPIGMVRMVGVAFKTGWSDLIQMMAMISLNLGLLNLLPIPILDGGVMLMVTVEGLARRELSLRFKERMVQVSFVGLLMLMAFVIYNDIAKTIRLP